MRRGLWIRLAALSLTLAGVVATGFASTAGAQEPPIGPPTQEPSEAEVEFWEALLECPTFAGTELVAEDLMYLDGSGAPSLQRICRLQDETIDTGRQIQFQARWFKEGTPDTSGTCGSSGATVQPDEENYPRGISTPSSSHSVTASWTTERSSGVPEAELERVAAEWIALLEPYALECAEDPVAVVCPEIEGLVANEPFLSDSESDSFEASCSYQSTDTEKVRNLRIGVYWLALDNPPKQQYLCSAETFEELGYGSIGTDGEVAAYASYVVPHLETYEAHFADAAVAAADLLAQVRDQAIDCTGVEIRPLSDLYTELPSSLDAAYAPELISGPGASVGAVGGGGAPGIGPGGGDANPLFRYVGLLMTVVSVLSLALTVYMVRHPSRIRPRFDVVRVVLIAGFAVGVLVLFTKPTPLWAVIVAIGCGLGLGLVQGQNTEIEMKPKGPYGRRTGFAVVAFLVGLGAMQVAGFANRSGWVAIGVAVSFGSAAIAAGVIRGRRDQLAEARAAVPSATAGIVLVAAFALVLGVAGPAVATPAPSTPSQLERPEVPEETRVVMVDAIDWSQVELHAGIAAGVEPVILDVAAELAEPPDPVTRTIEYSTDENTTWELTERFAFTPDAVSGLCCAIDYEADGFRTFDSGSGGDPAPVSADATLDLVPLRGYTETEFPGMPFSNGYGEYDPATETSRCLRDVGVAPDPTASYTYSLDTREDRLAPPRLSLPCESVGLTLPDVLETLPEPPPAEAQSRVDVFDPGGTAVGGCPVRQELIGAVAAHSFDGVGAGTVYDLATAPNAQACAYGSLFEPVVIGTDGPGQTRHELVVRYPSGSREGRFAEATEDIDTFQTMIRPYQVENPCEVDAGNNALPGDDPENPCRTVLFSKVADRDGNPGQLWVETDWDTSDGPNVTIRSHLASGKVLYRCHHCTPDDPRIADMLGALNDFMADGRGSYDGDGPIEDTGQVNNPNTEVSLGDVGLGDGRAVSDESLAAAALLGLLASLGVLGTVLAEHGATPADLLAALRERGIDGVDDLLALDPDLAGDLPPQGEGPPPELTPFVDFDGSRPPVSDGSIEGVPIGWIQYHDPSTGEATWMSREDAEWHRDRWSRLTADADRSMAESIAAHDARAEAARDGYLDSLYAESDRIRIARAQQEAFEEWRRDRIEAGARRVAAEQSSEWRNALHDALERGDHLEVESLYREGLGNAMDSSRDMAEMWSGEANREAWAEWAAQRTVDASRAGVLAVGGPLGLPATAIASGSISAAGGASEGVHRGEAAAQIAARAGAGFISGVKDAALNRFGQSGASIVQRISANAGADAAEAYVNARLNGMTHEEAAHVAGVTGVLSAGNEWVGGQIDGLAPGMGRTAAQVGTGSVRAGLQAAATAREGEGFDAFTSGMAEGLWGGLAGQAGGAAGGRMSGFATDAPRVGDTDWVASGRVQGEAADPLVAGGQDGTYHGEGYAVGAGRTQSAAELTQRLGASGRGDVLDAGGNRVLQVLPDGQVVDLRGRPVDPTSITQDASGGVTGWTEARTDTSPGGRIELGGDGPTRTTMVGEGPDAQPVIVPEPVLTGRGHPADLEPDVASIWRSQGAGQAERVVDPVTGETSWRAPVYGQDGRVVGHVDEAGTLTNVNGARITDTTVEGGRVTGFTTDDGSTFRTSAGDATPADISQLPGGEARGATLADDTFLRGMSEGDEIPASHIHETGANREHMDAIADAARTGYVDENGQQRAARIGQRTTNMEALENVMSGRSTEKPMPIKGKTIKIEDTILNPRLSVDDVGDVGFMGPDQMRTEAEIRQAIGEMNLSDDARAQLTERVLDQREARLREHAAYGETMAALEADGYAQLTPDGKVVTGPNYRVETVDAAGNRIVVDTPPPGTAFAGDIDGVYIVDAETGRPLSHDEAMQVVRNLRGTTTGTQHGFETYVGDDLATARGLTPGTPEYEQARMEEFAGVSFLEANQRTNAEVVWEIGPDGVPRRGARLNSLDPNQVVGGVRFTPTDASGASPTGDVSTSSLGRIAADAAEQEEDR